MTTEKRPTVAQDIRLFAILGVAVVILLVFLSGEQAALADYQIKIKNYEAKLISAKETIRKNHELLLPAKNKILNPTLLAEKSLLTVVKEATEAVGIGGSLEALGPSVDKRRGLLRARVSLRGVSLRNIVQFIVTLKNLSAGIRDKDANLRMLGYNMDRWRLDLTLEAPVGIQKPKKK